MPETVKNFVSLLKGDNPDGSTYKGTEAYRVLDGLNVQVCLRGYCDTMIDPTPRQPLCYDVPSFLGRNYVAVVLQFSTRSMSPSFFRP